MIERQKLKHGINFNNVYSSGYVPQKKTTAIREPFFSLQKQKHSVEIFIFFDFQKFVTFLAWYSCIKRFFG